MSKLQVNPQITVEPESVTLLGITTQYLKIKNNQMHFTIEMNGEEIKNIIEFWEEIYSLALKRASVRILELEQCIRTMKTVK